nr:retrovirus-related Pol polyprotein from transposon TNT 1-94 [Tanacetum cinerariifolium]
MIFESVENGPLIWPTIEENGVTRPKKYSELSAAEATQADCDSSQYGSPYQSSTPLSITYLSNDYQSSVHHNIYSTPSSIPQMKYAPIVTQQQQQSEFLQLDLGLIVPVFKQGDDPIDAINHMMSLLSTVVTSRFPTTNNQAQANGQILPEEELAFLADPRILEVALMANLSHYGLDALAEVHNTDNVDNNMINQVVQVMLSSEQSNVVNQSETKITSDSNIIPYSHDTLTAELERYKEQVKVLKEGQNVEEQGLIIAALRDELKKLKGKTIVDNTIITYTIDPEMLKVDVEPIAHRLLNNRTVQFDYLRLTQKQAVILREVNKDKRVRLVEHVISSGNTNIKTTSSSNLVSNKPMLSSTEVKPSTSASGSQPSSNTKKNKIQQPPSSTQKNKVKAHLRTVKSSLKRNSCPLTRIATTTEVPFKKTIALETDTPKPVVTLVYSRKSKTTDLVRKSKVVQIVLWYLDSGCSKHMTGDRSQLTNFVNKFLGTAKFGNDHVALKTKSWLWHRRLYHLNFGTINHLARHGLVRGLPKLNFEKDHLCSACAMGKSKKKPHKPKSKDTNQDKLYLFHMDLCGPMRVASVNGKKLLALKSQTRMSTV